jgi:Mycoplasma protein of unknown function, DUF285
MFSCAYSFNSDIAGWEVTKLYDLTTMFLGANNFNQDLCAWRTSLPSYSVFESTFSRTSCASTSDPASVALGPFCAVCPSPAMAGAVFPGPSTVQYVSLSPSLSFAPSDIAPDHARTNSPSVSSSISPTNQPSTSSPTVIPSMMLSSDSPSQMPSHSPSNPSNLSPFKEPTPEPTLVPTLEPFLPEPTSSPL